MLDNTHAALIELPLIIALEPIVSNSIVWGGWIAVSPYNYAIPAGTPTQRLSKSGFFGRLFGKSQEILQADEPNGTPFHLSIVTSKVAAVRFPEDSEAYARLREALQRR